MSLFSENCLLGKKILVTGASSGIGRASSILLDQCGADLILCGRELSKLNETLNMLKNPAKHRVECINFNSIEQSALEFNRISNHFGKLDGIFHAAGASKLKPSKLLTDKDVCDVFGPSLFAALAIAKVFSKKQSLNEHASIVIMSSVAGLVGQQGMTLYSASKSGIDGLVRSLACEMSSSKIRVNSIAAGGVITEMHEEMVRLTSEDTVKSYEAMHLLGFGSTSDIASLVVFMMSDASRWITGSTIVADGGYTAR